jgi:hypothetical protein
MNILNKIAHLAQPIFSFMIAVSMAVYTIPAMAQAPSANDENFILSDETVKPKSGNIYYSSNKKNELLFKANVWGGRAFPWNSLYLARHDPT